jgi:hypothetical protein
LHFFIRIIHRAKLPGGKKGHQRKAALKAEQIDMADATGMDHNCFGMSVNQSADVHAAEGKTIAMGTVVHTIDGDVERLTPVFVRSKLQMRDNGALLEMLSISFH